MMRNVSSGQYYEPHCSQKPLKPRKRDIKHSAFIRLLLARFAGDVKKNTETTSYDTLRVSAHSSDIAEIFGLNVCRIY